MNQRITQSAEEPFAFVQQQMRHNTHKTSFMSQALETVGDSPEMQAIHKWSAVSMYLGGADTTVSSLMVFFLAMMLFPSVQKSAQEELDRVLGDRLAVSADREALPYIWALVLEIHRWHTVGPMGLPHTTTKEDFVRGYRIPKGAIILSNIWWFTHDPAVYHDPMSFRPERFINTPTHKAEPDPRTWIFGYGRRICPGKLVADNALFVTVAQTLAVFDVQMPVDEAGRRVVPVAQFEPGIVSHPLPYRAGIKPRSEEHEKRIKKAGEMYPWEESDEKALEGVKW
jgi:cytochrome P450